jgi:hypothetical protein
MSPNAGIPPSGLNVLGRGAFLQQQMTPAVENQHMGDPMNKGRIAVAFGTERPADYPVVLVNNLKPFRHNPSLSIEKWVLAGSGKGNAVGKSDRFSQQAQFQRGLAGGIHDPVVEPQVCGTAYRRADGDTEIAAVEGTDASGNLKRPAIGKSAITAMGQTERFLARSEQDNDIHPGDVPGIPFDKSNPVSPGDFVHPGHKSFFFRAGDNGGHEKIPAPRLRRRSGGQTQQTGRLNQKIRAVFRVEFQHDLPARIEKSGAPGLPVPDQ